MRVLFVSPYPPAKDGIGTYTRVVGGSLTAAGHTFAVAVPRPLEGAPPEVIGHLGDLDALTTAIARFAPDVVHVQFAVPAFGTRSRAVRRLLNRLGGSVPVVATMHEVTRDTELLRGPGRALYRSVVARASRVTAHTGAAVALLARLGAREPVLLPHFAAPPPPAARKPSEVRAEHGLDGARLLLMFGFIHYHKGLDDLVRALALLAEADPALAAEVRLVVAGSVRRRSGLFRIMEAVDHAHHARARRLARRLGVADQITSTAFVPDGDIAAWFGAAEAVVLPYRRAEQSGVANLALAYGTPVLGTDAGGLAELLAGSPWTVPPARPDLLAAMLARFLRTGPHTVPARPGTGLDEVTGALVALYRSVTDGR
ncbi:glycosyltransferase [Actinocorallia sp. API 0066]|uniref:glycosyltransferase n=1 Tax=Actinocorallia sp. API 0066 TaxID=2896846 RepID=UPI001E564803|nr:glycosyltransferase [Actinocorallia sp. API 0066]MCD0450132.1 glycosyltransferase [Actinocorallia sp. API 0066]